jgi:hypothetical protein
MAYVVFDVESIGLHGEGWAVGLVVVNDDGEIIDPACFACPPEAAAGGEDGRQWVRNHVPPLYTAYETPREVRTAFWDRWRAYRGAGHVLVADCGWPVEARFLAACVDDDPESRAWQGPYPLHELASFMLAAGLDPLAPSERLADEPEHDPLGDARQSARLLRRALAATVNGSLGGA